MGTRRKGGHKPQFWRPHLEPIPEEMAPPSAPSQRAPSHRGVPVPHPPRSLPSPVLPEHHACPFPPVQSGRSMPPRYNSPGDEIGAVFPECYWPGNPQAEAVINVVLADLWNRLARGDAVEEVTRLDVFGQRIGYRCPGTYDLIGWTNAQPSIVRILRDARHATHLHRGFFRGYAVRGRGPAAMVSLYVVKS